MKLIYLKEKIVITSFKNQSKSIIQPLLKINNNQSKIILKKLLNFKIKKDVKIIIYIIILL